MCGLQRNRLLNYVLFTRSGIEARLEAFSIATLSRNVYFSLAGSESQCIRKTDPHKFH